MDNVDSRGLLRYLNNWLYRRMAFCFWYLFILCNRASKPQAQMLLRHAGFKKYQLEPKQIDGSANLGMCFNYLVVLLSHAVAVNIADDEYTIGV